MGHFIFMQVERRVRVHGKRRDGVFCGPPKPEGMQNPKSRQNSMGDLVKRLQKS
jgi:hypothetical protein